MFPPQSFSLKRRRKEVEEGEKEKIAKKKKNELAEVGQKRPWTKPNPFLSLLLQPKRNNQIQALLGAFLHPLLGINLPSLPTLLLPTHLLLSLILPILHFQYLPKMKTFPTEEKICHIDRQALEQGLSSQKALLRLLFKISPTDRKLAEDISKCHGCHHLD